MIEKEQVVTVIYNAIDEINQRLSAEQRLNKTVDTILYGPSSKLDSLGLVNLVVAVEEAIEDEFDQLVNIADAQAIAQGTSPLATVGSLADYTLNLLQERADVLQTL